MSAGDERRIERVVTVGGGAAGAGIAQVLAVANHEVTFCGQAESLALVRTEVDAGRYGLLAACDAGRISSEERRQALARLSFSELPSDALADADLLLVTAEGPSEATRTLLASLETVLMAGAVLACNSEGTSIAVLAEALQRPERLVGWRWGWPAQTSKLAEIIRSPLTSAGTTETVVEVARRCGKNPVVIDDAPEAWGYVTNRVRSALRAEASRIVEEGVATRAQVDQLMVDCFGWPTGPFGRGAQPH